jgi:hypothetical protein
MNQRKKPIDRDNKSKAIWVAAEGSFAAILGLLAIFFFGTNVFALVDHYRVSACSNLYEDRDLEILSYGDRSDDGVLSIRGTLHPDGIEVYTNDNSVSLMSLNGSDSLIQMAPSEESVIGKRIKVRYFVGKVEDHRWWHPAPVNNQIQFNDRALIRIWAMIILFLGALVTCFVYTYRKNREFEPLAKHLGSDET